MLSVPVASSSARSGPVFSQPGGSVAADPIGLRWSISVSGTYTPLAMACGSDHRVLWYAPGRAPDSMWRGISFPDRGSPSFTVSPMVVNGDYRPFTGDFDGDGCEDVFWYAPGGATDSVWYFAPDGTYTSVPVRVDGRYISLVGDFDDDAADDVFWYGPGAPRESIWSGDVGRTFGSSAAPQVNGTYTPVVAIDDASILWFRSGPGEDLLWRAVRAGTTSPGSQTRTTVNGTYVARRVGGTAVLLASGPALDQAVVGAHPAPGGASSRLQTLGGSLPDASVITDSTARAGFGVVHVPGPGSDLLVRAGAAPDYYRQPLAPDGRAPSIGTYPHLLTPDGHVVVMTSRSPNLVGTVGTGAATIVAWDRRTGTYDVQPSGTDGLPVGGEPVAVSADGSQIVFVTLASNAVAGDTNEAMDVYVWDRTSDTYERQPPGIDGLQLNRESGAGGMSADGRLVGIATPADNFLADDVDPPDEEEVGDHTDAAVWNRDTGAYEHLPTAVGGARPNLATGPPLLSDDGTTAIVESAATNLMSGNRNPGFELAVWDRVTDTLSAQPLGNTGQAPSWPSDLTGMSGDGRFVSLLSSSSELVEGDEPDVRRELFVLDRATGHYERAPSGVGTNRPDDDLNVAGWTDDGRHVALWSRATNLVPGDTNGTYDVFLWDRWTGSYTRQPAGDEGVQPTYSSAMGITGDGSLVLLASGPELAAGPWNSYGASYLWRTGLGG